MSTQLSSNLDTLAQQLFDLNETKGWHADPITDPRVFACALVLIGDELWEVSEADNNLELGGKPEGRLIEFVDVAWRTLELVVWLGYRPSRLLGVDTTVELCAHGGAMACLGSPGDEVTHWLAMQQIVNNCIRMVRKREPSREIANKLMRFTLSVLGKIYLLGEQIDVGVLEAFQIKYDYNLTRKHRHGGKAF